MKVLIERAIGSRSLRAVLLLALLTLLAWYLDAREILGYFDADMLIGIVLIQPIILAGYFFNAIRFVLLVRKPRIPLKVAFKALLLSYGLHALLPARISEIVKATYIRDHAGVSFGKGIATVFLERVADLLYVGVLAAIGVSFLVSRSYGVAAALIGFASASLAAMVVLKRPLIAAANRLRWTRVRGVAIEFVEHINACLRSRAFYLALAVGSVVWICACTSVIVMLWWAGSIPIGLGGCVTVFIASVIGGAIPALPAGLGTYEAAVAVTLKGLGYSLEEAIAIGIALHAGQLLISLTGALFILTMDRTGLRALLRDALAQSHAARPSSPDVMR